MLHPFWELWLILALIYLTECFIWIPHEGTVLLRRCGLWHGRHAAGLLARGRGGWVGLSPWPWEPAYRVLFPPVSVHGQRIVTGSAFAPLGTQATRPSARIVEITGNTRLIRRGREVFADSVPLADVPGEAQARALHAWIQRAVAVGFDHERVASIFWDEDHALRQHQSLSCHGRGLRWSCTVLFAGLFLGLPVLFVVGAPFWIWVASAGAILAAHGVNTVLFFFAHRRQYPELREERFRLILLMVLAPTAGMRAWVRLGLDAFELNHPLVVAQGLLPDAALKRLAASCWRDARYPQGELDEDRAVRCVRQGDRQVFLDRMEALIRGRGWDASQWERVDPYPGAVSYCPRCLNQYTIVKPSCDDCHRATKPFPVKDEGNPLSTDDHQQENK